MNSDHLRQLAVQAWKRVTQMGHDPVESITKALVYATAGKPVPQWVDSLYPSQREVALVLLSGPQALRGVAHALGINRRAACLRLRRMRAQGLVHRGRHGVYHLVEAADAH